MVLQGTMEQRLKVVRDMGRVRTPANDVAALQKQVIYVQDENYRNLSREPNISEPY